MTANLYEKNGRFHVMLSWMKVGKRKQKSVGTGISTTGNNKRKAEAARRQILAEWEEKITENHVDILFSEYMLQWLETAKHSIAETTYADYKRVIKNQINPYFAQRKIKLHDLKPYHIQEFYKFAQDERDVSASTVRHYHSNIHKALKDAMRQEIIKDNPASRVTLPKKKRFYADFYTAEEMRLLLETVKGHKIEIPVYLACWFGLRRGEALGLRWKDIDFEEMTLSVRGVLTDKGEKSHSENLKYRDEAKTASSIRTFPLPAEAANYLKRLKEKQAENRLLAGSFYSLAWADFVCVDDIGQILSPAYVSEAFAKFLKANGLRKVRFHDLRDSNASLLLAKGVDMKRIQSWMGHAHFSTTADIYAHLRKDAKQGLGELLSKELSAENP